MDVEDGGAHERRGTQGVQFAAFCLVFATIVRYLIDTGGAFTASDTKASQMSDVDVDRIRAEPFAMAGGERGSRRNESSTNPTASSVASITVAPAGTLSDVAEASFNGAPPEFWNTSTATMLGVFAVEVQERKAGPSREHRRRAGVRAQYHPDYYAAFVVDPDGHRIEAVCHAPEEAMIV